MGFLSALKGIGKAVAPIAASFIPGIGPIAGPALAGLLNKGGLGPSDGMRIPLYAGGSIDIGGTGQQNDYGQIGEAIGGLFRNRNQAQPAGEAKSKDKGTAPGYPNRSETNYAGRMRGLGPVMGRRDQNFPNLAEAIGAGRQESIMNQPWRTGYDVTMPGEETEDAAGNNIYGPPTTIKMPPVYPTGGGGRFPIGGNNRRRLMMS